MLQLILGYLVLLVITSAICLSLLFLLRRSVWRKKTVKSVERQPRRHNKVKPPREEIQRASRNESLSLRRRIGLFRQYWRDATIADLLAGFRLPASAFEPVFETVDEEKRPIPEKLAIQHLDELPSDMPAGQEWTLETLSNQGRPLTPLAITVAANGDLVVVDAEQKTILRFDSAGILKSSWPAPWLQLEQITGLAISPEGDIFYFIDGTDKVLRMVRLTGTETLSSFSSDKDALAPRSGEIASFTPPDQQKTRAAPSINRWKLFTALGMGAAGIVLTLIGLLLTQGKPPENAPSGIRTLLGGILMFLFSNFIIDRLNAANLPLVLRRLTKWLDKLLDNASSWWSWQLKTIGQKIKAGSMLPGWMKRLAGWLNIAPWQAPFLLLAPVFSAVVYPLAGDAARAKFPVTAAGCWLVGLFLVILGGWQFHRKQQDSDVTVNEVIIVVLILFLALLLRITATGHIPVILGGDEGVIGYASVAFAEGKSDNLFNTTLSSPSFYFALQGLSIRVFGHTIEALRFSSTIAGVLAVLATYWLARVLFGRWMALLAGAFMAAFHFNIHFSRIALQNIWEELFAAIILAGLVEGWKNNRRSGFLLAGLAMGLAQNFFPAVRLLFVVLFFWFLLLLIRDRKYFFRRMPDLVLFGVVLLTVILPLAHYYIENPAIYTEPIPRSFILSGSGPAHTHVFGSGQTMAEVLKKQFRLAVLGFTHEHLQDWYTPESPLLLPIPAALFVIGFLAALFRVLDPRYALLILLVIGDLVLGVALTTDPPAGQRLVIAAPSVVILAMLPLERMGKWLGMYRPWLTKSGRFAILLILLFIMIGECYFYFDVYTPGRNFRVANDEIAQRVAEHVNRLTPGGRGWDIYCVCPPRMGYWTHPAMAYLAPDAKGYEVTTPFSGPPEELEPGQKALFIFLPERLAELSWVKQAYPDGLQVDHWYHNGQLLFTSYETIMPW